MSRTSETTSVSSTCGERFHRNGFVLFDRIWQATENKKIVCTCTLSTTIKSDYFE